MDSSSKTNLFPWITILAGTIGLAIRVVLLSLADSKGLLPGNHIAGILSIVLTALALGGILLVARKAADAEDYAGLFPASNTAAAGSAVGAVGMGVSGFFLPVDGGLAVLSAALGVLCAAGLVAAAYCRYRNQQPNGLLFCVAAVYMIVRTMACCRAWGAEPQLQMYLFQLLTSLFLLLAIYYRAELTVGVKHYRRFVFFSQAALLCCCMCLAGQDRLFYLSAGVWLAADYLVLPSRTQGN